MSKKSIIATIAVGVAAVTGCIIAFVKGRHVDAEEVADSVAELVDKTTESFVEA